MAPYPIKLIPQGLSSEETVLHIASSLGYLNAVANCIFQSISEKIDSEVEYLGRMTTEIQSIESKVAELQDKKTASQWISSSQYPGKDEVPYTSAFAFTKSLPIEEIQEFSESGNSEPRKEVFSFRSSPKKKVFNHQHDRFNLKSAASTLLFNTSERAYLLANQRDVLDPLHPSQKIHAKISKGVASSVGYQDDASETEEKEDSIGMGLEKAPDLDLPDDLDLENIATRLNGDKPTTEKKTDCSSKPEFEGSVAIPEPIFNPPLASHIPPPPPPPPLPPVPPPIPPSLPTLLSAAANPPVLKPKVPFDPCKEKAAPLSMTSDSRGDLLSAIRNAGGASGAGLRSAKDRKLKSPQPTEVVDSVSSGVDLMKMLADNLRLRRKGMSGKGKDEESGDNDPVLRLPRASDDDFSTSDSSSVSDSDW